LINLINSVRGQPEQDCCTGGAEAGAEGGPNTDSLTRALLTGLNVRAGHW